MFKKILRYTALSLLVAGLGAYFYFATLLVRQEGEKARCQKMHICIVDSLENPLLKGEEVLDFLYAQQLSGLGRLQKEVQLHTIEEALQGFSSVKDCNASCDIGGRLHIRLHQYRPVLRVLTDTASWYLCREGFVLPVAHPRRLKLPLLTGQVPWNYAARYRGPVAGADSLTLALQAFARYLQADSFWRDQVAQIQMDSPHQISLSPRAGNTRLQIGSLDLFPAKMQRLKEYYQVIVPLKGLDHYTVVDARYKNQLVCTRRKTPQQK